MGTVAHKPDRQLDDPKELAGIYGGITMAQYHEIASLPGVSVAAPIAMVGYALVDAAVPFTIPAADYSGPGRRPGPTRSRRSGPPFSRPGAAACRAA